MGKHSWVMYMFLIILIGVVLANAAGSVALILAGGQAGGNFVTALRGPATSSKGSFSFGGTNIKLG